jgi:uncharacterized damage-inducible protein DinB
MSDGADSFADPRLRDLDPRPSPLPAPLVRAREDLARSTSLFLSIPDSALESEWAWIGEGEGDIRSGFYVAVQALERAAGQVRRSATGPASEAAPGRATGPAAGPIGAATEARWDLQGLLVALDEDSLDADPGDGEWTVRRALAHTLASQRAYGWFSAWWMRRGDAADYPPSIPDAVAEEMEAQLPEAERNADGSVADIRARLDALVDLTSELWRDTSDEELAIRARWMGFPVTTGFRVGRWSTHIQEHTIQVEKTLAMLDRAPTEVQRMVRLLYRSFGRMEAAAWEAGLAGGEVAEPAAKSIESAVAEVEGIAADIAEVAGRS